MQAQAALVGTNGAVELHAVATVHLHIALVVHPRYTEKDHPLGLHIALQQARLFIFGVLVNHRLQGGQNLRGRLDKLLFMGIAGL